MTHEFSLLRRRRAGWLLMFAVAALSHAVASAEEAGPPDKVDFVRDVQPIFVRHCYDCHGPDTHESGYRLDQKAAALGVGDYGDPPIAPGKGDESPLYALVAGESDYGVTMPPEGNGKPLTPQQIATIKAWIDQGAEWPEDAHTAAVQLTTDHWSFQPVQRPAPPAHDDAWGARPIDAFLLARLKEKNLTPSPREERALLARRVHLVLHGLLPTPEEVQRYVDDDAPDAYEQLVERVLASPRYGERFARHWLDVARFAETTGFETNRERPHAYHYRDYVIRAFNDDKPYDQFIQEQLAGDALGADVGTGFLVAGPHDTVKSPDINLTLMQRQDELADMVNTTGGAFLGLTLGCARCHNHKFDPVLQKDYYAIQAIFDGVQHSDRQFAAPPTLADQQRVSELRKQWTEVERRLHALRLAARGPDAAERRLGPPVSSRKNEDKFAPVVAQAIRFSVYATNNDAAPCLDELEVFDTHGANAALGAEPTASGTISGYDIHQLQFINDGKYGNDWSWIADKSTGWVQLTFQQPVEIERVQWQRDREGRLIDRVPIAYTIEVQLPSGEWQTAATSDDREAGNAHLLPADIVFRRLVGEQRAAAEKLVQQAAALQGEIERLSTVQVTAYIGAFRSPGQTHRLHRGDPMAKKELVEPDALTVLGTLGLSQETSDQQRRLKLAEWIADRDNPLTARVMANRLWHYAFGAGLVDTPSDFGVNGSAPTHPELLDWLAAELVDSGWSLKHVQRQILLSNAFQQSSRPRDECAAVDADSRLLWRFPPRRLEAEPIRDNMLRVSGALNLEMYGPGFSAFEIQYENVRHYFPRKDFGPNEWRRMIYMTKVRQEQDSVFGLFDCPDGNQTVPKRTRSTTPLQALNLFNSLFVNQQADRLAARLQQEAGADPGKQADRAFELFFGRAPDNAERQDAVELIQTHGLPSFGRALFNANEFLFLF